MSKLSAQEGRALALTLIALAVGCLLIPPFLSYISTNLLASHATEEGMREQYAADAGVEYVAWKLAKDVDFLELAMHYTITNPLSVDMPAVNGIALTLTVGYLDIPNPWPGVWGGQGSVGLGQGVAPGTYWDVYFRDDHETGWAVGGEGLIVKTYDGGYNWAKIRGEEGEPYLYSVSRTSGGIWTAGKSGTIWYVDDDSEETTSRPWPPDSNLKSIQFLDDYTGWVVGGTGTGNLLKTVDGGSNWNQVVYPDPKALESVFFVDADHGWAVGAAGTVITTTNGGIDWFSQTISDKYLNDVYFLDELHGWAVGGSANQDGPATIYKTWDGGQNWHLQADIDAPVNFDLQGVTFISTTITATTTITGWVVGEFGNIRVMTHTIPITETWDFEDDWNFIASGTTSDLNSVYFTDATHGWAVGDIWSIIIYCCDEGGCGWEPPNRITPADLRAVWLSSDGEHGWTVGDTADIDDDGEDDWIIGVTQDGIYWDNVELSQLPDPHDLFGVSFPPDMSVGWAVGATGTILKSSDGGETWVKQDSPESEENLNAVYAISSTLAYAVGDAGLVLETTDGEAWSPWDVGLSYDLYDIDFFCDISGSCTGWAVGDSGRVIKITDAGSSPSFVNQTGPAGASPKALHGVCAVDSDTVWAVGASATIIVSSNGGDTWSEGPGLPSSNFVLRAVDFTNQLVGSIVGDMHSVNVMTILATNDGTETWISIESGGGKDLLDVAIEGPCSSWAVGADGTMLHFICVDIETAGGCGFFDIESVANDAFAINSRVHLCLDGLHIDSWDWEME